MKTSYLYGAKDIRIEEISDSEPGPGQVLLNVTAVGVCGSDLHTYLFGNVGGIAAEGPLTLGHEAASVVLEVGEGVEDLKVGQRVAIDPAIHCGHCERCIAGDIHLCERIMFMGLWPHQGAMRERMVYPASACVPMPDDISDVGAALLEPLGVALHASRLADVQIGEDVLVVGCGGIGLLLIRLARLAGARRIFATDKHPWRLEQAAAYGADDIINANEEDVVAHVMHATNKRGVDVAIEAAWVEGTADQCMNAARFGGRVILVGIPAEDFITIKASVARRKELAILPSRRMKNTYPAAIALAQSGQVDVDSLATHRFTLDQAKNAFDTASLYVDGVVRAVVLPNAK
ncbi:MAG: alcohol dehydrogenase catalytic domain-containing protein [Chloroflexota bacterium]